MFQYLRQYAFTTSGLPIIGLMHRHFVDTTRGSLAHMAMGSGAVAGKAAPAEVTSGYGVDSQGGAQHRPGAEGRMPQRTRQRTTRRFGVGQQHWAMQTCKTSGISGGALLSANRPEESCRVRVPKLEERTKPATIGFEKEPQAMSRQVAAQAQLSSARFRKMEA